MVDPRRKVTAPGREFQRQFEIDRGRLVRYAAASGDLNPIHWHDRAALAAGLENVIAHGMLTMGAASAVVVDALDDPTRIQRISVRFARPVVVPDTDEGTVLEINVQFADLTTATFTATANESIVLKDGSINVTPAPPKGTE